MGYSFYICPPPRMFLSTDFFFIENRIGVITTDLFISYLHTKSAGVFQA